MTYYLVFLHAIILVLSWYIIGLHKRLRSHESSWEQIERMTDSNQEGDIIIHTHKVPEDVVVPIHRETDDEIEMERLLEQRNKLDEEIKALAQLMRLSR